jgi:chromosome segregation ATPase
MKIDIEEKKVEIERASQELNAFRTRLDSLRGSALQDDFNRDVDRFNSQLNNHRSRVSQLQAEIEKYNKLVSQFNATASDRRSLINSLENPAQ